MFLRAVGLWVPEDSGSLSRHIMALTFDILEHTTTFIIIPEIKQQAPKERIDKIIRQVLRLTLAG